MQSNQTSSPTTSLACMVALAMTGYAACAVATPASPMTSAETPDGAATAAITKETNFEMLRSIAKAKAQAANWYPVDFMIEKLLTLNVRSPLPDQKVLGQEDFTNWCTLKGGSPNPVASQAANTFLSKRGNPGYRFEVTSCKIGQSQYAYAHSSQRYGQFQSWLSPDDLAIGQTMADETRKASETTAREAAAKRAKEALEMAKASQERETFLQKSKSGTRLACESSVLERQLSAPITRARLDCVGGLETRMNELLSNGWELQSQTTTPDGDIGGFARTAYLLLFQKR